jgi:lipopolysaccharide export system protein LptA
MSPAFTSPGRSFPPRRVIAWLALAVAVGPALGERADRDQPLRFSADTLRYDDARRVNVLTGRVEITKGSLVLRADRVEVRQTPEGHHIAQATGSGEPAFFRQKREGLDEHLEGRAARIDYDGRTETVRLSGDAMLRRLQGTHLADEIQGQTITWDNAREVFTVQGGGADGSAGGRVRGVLTPRPSNGQGETR